MGREQHLHNIVIVALCTQHGNPSIRAKISRDDCMLKIAPNYIMSAQVLN